MVLKMTKPILPKSNFNNVFSGYKIKIVQIGDNKPFNDSEKYQLEAKLYPNTLDFEVIDAPMQEQIGRSFRIKVGKVNNLQAGDVLTIAPDKYQLTDSTVTWYASQGQRYGHAWTYVNTSIKGGEFVDRE